MKPWPALVKYANTINLPKQGINLFFYQAGDRQNPAMLMLHGLGDEADSWRHLVDPLSKRYHVIAPDLPGFGRSDKHETEYNIGYFTQVILELLDVLEIQRAVLVGNSLGAMIAQTIALEHPQRVLALILVDGSLWLPKQRLRLENLLFMVPRLGEWLYNRLRRKPQAAYQSLYPYYADISRMSQNERDFLYQRVNQRVWDDHQRRAYFSALRQMAAHVVQIQKEIRLRLKDLTVPALIIWGEFDRLIPIENAYALADLMENARLVILKDTGHVPQQENPDGTLEAIMQDDRFAGEINGT